MQGAILTNLADAQKNMASAEKVDARGLIHNLVDVCKKKEQVWLAVRI